MTARVLVAGGYGNFGALIARRLADAPEVRVIVAGRSAERARAFAGTIGADWGTLDVAGDLDGALAALAPDILIHTAGPFQGQAYALAEACIRRRCHYIDIADGRDFVAGITRLDAAARAAGVLVVSGASSVPAFTSAVVDHHRSGFDVLEGVLGAISTAQRATPGPATVGAILGYAGKPFTTLRDGRTRTVHGWQGLRTRRFAGLGRRCLSHCDVPDLALFPARYPTVRTVEFLAGLELAPVHLGLIALSWLVRAGLLESLAPLTPTLLAISRRLDRLGTGDSGFLVEMSGKGGDGRRKLVRFMLTARSGHGRLIPCLPAVLLALAIARGEQRAVGATASVGLLGLDAILAELGRLDVSWCVEEGPASP
jgi:saccharopine dehydrogenase-like NADP-dependent oxidoreductase